MTTPLDSRPRDRPQGNPIFELIEPARHIKIYANGVVDGAAQGARIVNHINTAIRPELWVYFSKSHEADPCRSPYAIPVPSSSASGLSHGANDGIAAKHREAATGEK